jgi:hypothetical protein
MKIQKKDEKPRHKLNMTIFSFVTKSAPIIIIWISIIETAPLCKHKETHPATLPPFNRAHLAASTASLCSICPNKQLMYYGFTKQGFYQFQHTVHSLNSVRNANSYKECGCPGH